MTLIARPFSAHLSICAFFSQSSHGESTRLYCRPRAGPASAAALKLLEAPALSARDSEARVIALLHCHDDIRSARAAALHRPLTGRNSHWQ